MRPNSSRSGSWTPTGRTRPGDAERRRELRPLLAPGQPPRSSSRRTWTIRSSQQLRALPRRHRDRATRARHVLRSARARARAVATTSTASPCSRATASASSSARTATTTCPTRRTCSWPTGWTEPRPALDGGTALDSRHDGASSGSSSMSPPITDFGRIVQQVFRGVRYLSYGCHRRRRLPPGLPPRRDHRAPSGDPPGAGHPASPSRGGLYLVSIGRPLLAFFRMPVVTEAAEAPGGRRPQPAPTWSGTSAFVETYVGALPQNPEWTGDPADVDARPSACAARCRPTRPARRTRICPHSAERVGALERGEVDRLLAPLDRKAADAIRERGVQDRRCDGGVALRHARRIPRAVA